MTRLQEYNYKLRLIAIIQDQLHFSKGTWSTVLLRTKPLADLKKVVEGFKSVIKTINIDSILMVLFTEENKKGLFKIKDSPHYKFLMGDEQPYLQYYQKYLEKSHKEWNKKVWNAINTRSTNVENGLFSQEMMSPQTYNQFMCKFKYLDKFNLDKHIKVIPFKRGYITRDGDHRLAILKFQKQQNIIVSIKRG